MYRKILVPMALTHNISPKMLQVAKALCADGGQIIALHVYESPQGSVSVYLDEDMVRTGMSPADVIVAATATSAQLLGYDELGTIEVGKSADFVVLDANPLDDITNTRRISAVYLRGERLDRAELAEKFLRPRAQ